jgi:hypothetical protein
MRELRHDLDFAEKSLDTDRERQLELERLEGDVPRVLRVARQVDRRRAAAADLALYAPAVQVHSDEIRSRRN